MNEKIRKAFDSVKAEEELKEKTLRRISMAEKRRPGLRAARLIPVLACLALVILAGGWAWFSPSATIRNDDGRELAAALDIKYMDYDRALEQIMDSEKVSSLLSGDGVMTLAVVGDNEAQCGRLLSGLRSCTAGQGNAYCYSASEEELEAAHILGLSFGKYKVYQRLIELGSSISPQEVNDMSMRELWDMIDGLSGGQSLPAGQGPLAPGKGQGQGSGQGKGPAWARGSES